MSEFEMAMIVSMRFWPGTSIVEGAYEIMAQMRRYHAHCKEAVC